MKKILVITFIIFAHSFSLEENVCFKKATRMLSDVGDSFKVGSLDGMIDSLSNMFIQLPTLLNTCGND